MLVPLDSEGAKQVQRCHKLTEWCVTLGCCERGHMRAEAATADGFDVSCEESECSSLVSPSIINLTPCDWLMEVQNGDNFFLILNTITVDKNVQQLSSSVATVWIF